MDLTRTIHPDTLAALQSGSFHPAMLVWLDWPGEALYVHSGSGQIAWNGNTYSGVSVGDRSFGRPDIPDDGPGLVPAEATLSLVVPSDAVDEVLDAQIRNLSAAIYFAVVTERAGSTLIGEPFELFTGHMDAISETAQRKDGVAQHIIRLGLGTGPSPRASASIVHSPEDQSRAYPGDTIGRLLINSAKRAERVVL